MFLLVYPVLLELNNLKWFVSIEKLMMIYIDHDDDFEVIDRIDRSFSLPSLYVNLNLT